MHFSECCTFIRTELFPGKFKNLRLDAVKRILNKSTVKFVHPVSLHETSILKFGANFRNEFHVWKNHFNNKVR